MLDLEQAPEPAALLSTERRVPLDRSIVIVRASLERVREALAPFAAAEPVDATDALARGQGIDDVLEARGRRAVAYVRRGAQEVGIVREGPAHAAHDVPLARRISASLHVPAVALHVAACDVTYDLFHDGAALERVLCTSGELASAESRFEFDAAEVARDPYGRALTLLQAYGLGDDRLGFEDFARGAILLRRWDVTIERCVAWPELRAWAP